VSDGSCAAADHLIALAGLARQRSTRAAMCACLTQPLRACGTCCAASGQLLEPCCMRLHSTNIAQLKCRSCIGSCCFCVNR
jgi:hypothetical protein